MRARTKEKWKSRIVETEDWKVEEKSSGEKKMKIAANVRYPE